MKSSLSRFISLAALSLLLWLQIIPACPAQAPQPAVVHAYFTSDVRMRDGTRLAADIYLPSNNRKFPVILYRTPYDPRGELIPAYVSAVTRAGYALVINHCRGRYDSLGMFTPLVNEARDTYDVATWISKQPWCNGSIATTGASYCGMLQLQVAPYNHPNVKAMFIMVSPSDIYRDVAYPGGAFALQTMCNWLSIVSRRTVQDWRFTDWYGVMRHLPLETIDGKLGRSLPVLRQYLAHPDYSPYWKSLFSTDNQYSRITVPIFMVSGWNDPFIRGTLRSFAGLQAANAGRTDSKDRFRILVGPWDHLGAITGLATRFGEVEYGPSARVDVTALSISWFDKWLKDGNPKQASEQPEPLRLFLTGKNRWIDAKSWPPENSRNQPFYLQSAGNANTRMGGGKLSAAQPQEQPPDTYAYNPEDPVTSLMSHHILFASGPRDFSLNEHRKDMLVYTSEPLERDLFVAGDPRLVLFIRSDAPDTDFSAWLCETYPDGRSVALQDGIVRCSRFLGKPSDSALSPGTTYKVEIELGSVCHVFKAGHRLRLDISSSNFPAFDRNLNTGKDNWKEVVHRTANQTVMHSSQAASHLILPVVSPAVANREK